MKKRIPERDVHMIDNVKIKLDNKLRFKSDYQRRYMDLEQRRVKRQAYDENGVPIPEDSPLKRPAGVLTNLKVMRSTEEDIIKRINKKPKLTPVLSRAMVINDHY